jgi:hypothetical protein
MAQRNLKIFGLVFPWVCLFLVGQICVNQYCALSRNSEEIRICRAAMKIADEQIRDLTYELQNSRIDEGAIQTRWFVAGIAAAMNRPDSYAEIWHDGYDRGVAVQQAAHEAEKTAAFTAGKAGADNADK